MCEEAAGGVFFRKSQISVKPSLREGPQCWIEKGGSFDYGEQSSIKLWGRKSQLALHLKNCEL